MKQNQIQCEIFLLLLEHYIQDLEFKLLTYEFQDELDKLTKDYKPDWPRKDPFEPKDWNCPTCGLKLNQVMGYCCPHPKCPTGLGPVMSGPTLS